MKLSTPRQLQVLEQDEKERIIPWAEGNGLWDTLSEVLNDLTGVDIITFFVQNPYTCDTAASLAMRVGRRTEQVSPVLERLSDTGLLKRSRVADLLVYEMTYDEHLRQTLQQYTVWLSEGYHWARMALNG